MSCVVNGKLHWISFNPSGVKTMGNDSTRRVNSPVKRYNIYKDKNIPQHMIDCWERNTQA